MDIGDLAHINAQKDNWKWGKEDGFNLVPFVGLVKQIIKPKGEKSVRGIIGWAAYSLGAFIKIATIPLYIYVGQQTNDWSPFNTLTYLNQEYSHYVVDFVNNFSEEKTIKKYPKKTFHINPRKRVRIDN